MLFATADLVDAHENLASCSLQLRTFSRSASFSGVIRTVRCRNDNALIRQVLSQAGKDTVLVIDGDGSLECALIGDVLAGIGASNGWAGIVVNGVIRDAAAIAAFDMGVKALGTNPRKSSKAGTGEIDVTVEYGGVRFVPGHYLYSDLDGIVVSAASLSPPP